MRSLGTWIFLLGCCLVLGGCSRQLPTPQKEDPEPPERKQQLPREGAESPKRETLPAAEPATTRDVFLMLPRFTKGVAFDDVKKAVESVPDAKFIYVRQDNLQTGTPGYFGISVRYDTAKVDVGDIAKALTALGGDKGQAVALLSLSRQTVISQANFAALKKELANAKGIDWKLSGPRGIALDEAGGAKYAEILAGYKKAGISLIGGADE